MMRKWFRMVTVLVVVAALALAGTAVLAQGDGEDEGETTPPFGFFGGRFGEHMDDMFGGRFGDHFGGRMGGMFGDRLAEMPMIATVTEALGLEADALLEALADGQTLAEIAEAQGVELDAIVDALVAAHAEQLAEAVAAGTLTQEQADAMQALHEANLRAHLADGEGFLGMRGFFAGGRAPMTDRGGFFGGMRGGRSS